MPAFVISDAEKANLNLYACVHVRVHTHRPFRVSQIHNCQRWQVPSKGESPTSPLYSCEKSRLACGPIWLWESSPGLCFIGGLRAREGQPGLTGVWAWGQTQRKTEREKERMGPNNIVCPGSIPASSLMPGLSVQRNPQISMFFIKRITSDRRCLN